MKRLIQLFALLLLVQVAAAQDAVQDDVPAEAAAQLAVAETYKNRNLLEQSQQEYSELLKKYPNSFSIGYDYGRLLAQMKEYQESAKILGATLKNGSSSGQLLDPSLYNTIGYVHLQMGEFDQALEYFKMATAPEIYRRLNEESRMKLHNNKGIALMSADRYEEALDEFAKARELGSQIAVKNIDKVNSRIETQEKQNPDLPGIFAVVIHSTKSIKQLDTLASTLTEKIQKTAPKEKQQELNNPVIYVMNNGMYVITLASNSSYAKARALLTVVKKVIPDAFVSSTTNWELYHISGAQVPTQEAPGE
ncbi:MAG: hypothetical protein SD837_04725 [Candidatus Electrothrix scaldis]|nr:MAG: hypothetical protein SD837_04725 [Candidatus Electrothrix sp. GW3-3]